MSVRAAIYDLLDEVTTSVYPLVAPQETTGSYAVFSVNLEVIRIQNGVEMKEADLILEIYSSGDNGFDSCVTLAESFYTALEGASGTYGGEALEVCNFIRESDDYISDLDKFNIRQEYNLKFN